MRPRIFHDLSRFLATLLEGGSRGGSDANRLPVYLCHPMDLLQDGQTDAERASGVLYLCRVSPANQYPQAGLFLGADTTRGPGGAPGGGGHLGKPGIWVRLRYVFLVVGGTLEDELSALAAAFHVLHGHPIVNAKDLGDDLSVGRMSEDIPELEIDAFPLSIVDAPDAWREIGLEEHRLSISFEVTLLLPSAPLQKVEPILERDLSVEYEDSAPVEEGGTP